MAFWPALITVIGGCLYLGLIPLIVSHRWGWAGIGLIVVSLADLVDGWLARRLHQVTPGGAILDSTVDRLSEAVIFGTLAYDFARRQDLLGVCLVSWAWAGAFLTSYARARAEAFIPRCQVGYMERAERIVVLAIGLVWDRLLTSLGLIAGLGLLAALQRVGFATWSTIPASSTLHPPPSTREVVWLYWTHPRYSLPWWLCTLFCLLVIFGLP